MRFPTLTGSTDDLDTLWSVLNKTRKGSKTLKVPYEALSKLLVDQGRLLTYIRATSD